jgi:hypothetical protein
MQKTVYLHIGSPKTGTTFIQSYLSDNSGLLLSKERILYPLSGRNVIAHHPLAGDIRNKFNGDTIAGHAYGDNSRGDNWENLLKELEDKELLFDSVILSSEDFFVLFRKGELKAIEAIHDLLSAYKVVVVLYLRRQDQLVDSLFNQSIKATLSTNADLGKLIGEHPVTRKNYFEIVSAWATIFGKDNVLIRPYEPNSFKDRDLLSDFCSAVSLVPDKSFSIPAKQQNERLALEELYLKRSLNSYFDNNIECIEFFDKIRRINPVDGHGRFLSMKKEHYLKIIDRSSEVNRRLSEHFNSGRPFFQPFPEPSNIDFFEFDKVNLESYLSRLLSCVQVISAGDQNLITLENAIYDLSNEYQFESVTKKSIEIAFNGKRYDFGFQRLINFVSKFFNLLKNKIQR